MTESKFHKSPTTGRIEPCGATLRACPLGGGVEHYESAAAASQAGLLPEIPDYWGANGQSIREDLAAQAPGSMRKFFHREPFAAEDRRYPFHVRQAVEVFARAEFMSGGINDEEAFKSAMTMNRREKASLMDGLAKIASPAFRNDRRWQASAERRILQERLPRTLLQLEHEAAALKS